MTLSNLFLIFMEILSFLWTKINVHQNGWRNLKTLKIFLSNQRMRFKFPNRFYENLDGGIVSQSGT
jgi:hypothetical protein